MQKVDTKTWDRDFEALPSSTKLAWLGQGVVHSSIIRLEPDVWGFRPLSDEWTWYILSTAELMVYLGGLRVPEPYRPPSPSIVKPPPPPVPTA